MENSISSRCSNKSSLQEKSFPTRIGITGSPATGKKSVARELAKITGLELFLINDFVINKKLGKMQGSEFVVDEKKARKMINTQNRIVCGHLLPSLVPKEGLDVAIVLRCSPKILKIRYEERHYSAQKVTENVEAEMIGVIDEEARRVYGKNKLIEIDMTRVKSPKRAARRIFDIIRKNRIPTLSDVDWLSSIRSPRKVPRLSST